MKGSWRLLWTILVVAISALAFSLVSIAQPSEDSSEDPLVYVGQSSLETVSARGLSIIDMNTYTVAKSYEGFTPLTGILLSEDDNWLYVIHSNGLSSIDVKNRSVAKKMPLSGYAPEDIARSRDGKQVYLSVVGYDVHKLLILDSQELGIIDELIIPRSAGHLAVSPDGTQVHVANTYNEYNALPGRSGLDYYETSLIDVGKGTRKTIASPGFLPVSSVFSNDGSIIYIVNKNSDNITVINVTTGLKTGSIRTMRSPVDITISPDGSQLYVVNDYYDSSYVTIIDTVTLRINRTIDLRSYSRGEIADSTLKRIVASADGTHVYVANPGANSVSEIDTRSGIMNRTIKVDNEPRDICLSQDDSTLFVACKGGNSIVFIDTHNGTEIDTIHLFPAVRSVAFSPDGRQAYVTDIDTGSVSIIDTTTDTVRSTVSVGGIPLHVRVSPDGRRAYVTNNGRNAIDVIDAGTGRIERSIKTRLSPTDIAVSPDSKTLYLLLYDDGIGHLGVMNATSGKLIKTLEIGEFASGIDLTPDGRRIYATRWTTNDICAIDTSTYAVTWIKGEGEPWDVKASPDSSLAYTENTQDWSLSVIDTKTNKIIGKINLPVSPREIAITPDGSTAYVAGRQGVAVVNLTDRSVIKLLPISDAQGVAVNPRTTMPLTAAGKGEEA